MEVTALKYSSLRAKNSSWGDTCSSYELSVEFSLLVELEDWGVEEDDEEEEEEEEDEVKFIPDSSGGFVAVFCPLKLFLHTGQVSCCSNQGTMQSL